MYALGWCLSIHGEILSQAPKLLGVQGSKPRMLNSEAGCQNKRMGE